MHISKMIFEGLHISSGSLVPILKSSNRITMLWFNRKQVKKTSGKTEKENTFKMKSSELGWPWM